MAKSKSEYPDWVMEHKKKGTYINKVGDKYYLYAAHSERVKETGKIRRVCDGYLGRITEKDGFIPAKDKLQGASIRTFELGFSYALVSITPRIHAALRQSFVRNGDLVYICSLLNYVFGFYSDQLFSVSWLSCCFSDIIFPDSFTDAQLAGIERGTRMIADVASRSFGDDLPLIKALFQTVSLLSVNGMLYLPTLPERVMLLSEKYDIDWRNPLWQR